MVQGDRNKCILGLPLTNIEKINLSQLCVSLSKWTISYMYGFIQTFNTIYNWLCKMSHLGLPWNPIDALTFFWNYHYYTHLLPMESKSSTWCENGEKILLTKVLLYFSWQKPSSSFFQHYFELHWVHLIAR
jgi:hypothetical protein